MVLSGEEGEMREGVTRGHRRDGPAGVRQVGCCSVDSGWQGRSALIGAPMKWGSKWCWKCETG